MHWIYQFHSKNHLKLSTLVGLCHLFKDVLICSWENSADRWIYSPRECGTRNGKKCKALGTEQVCWNTKLHLFCLFRTMRLCAYIQNVVYVSIWTIYIYIIYVWWKTASIHFGLHIQPLRRFLHVFLRMLGEQVVWNLGTELKSTSKFQAKKMATTKLKSMQDWQKNDKK